MNLGCKERLGVVVDPTLHILRQADKGRAAIRWIEHRADRLRQRLQDLRGVSDTIPVTGHRFKRIRNTQRRVIEMFYLLQHRVRQTGREIITTEHQHREAICHCQCRGCN